VAPRADHPLSDEDRTGRLRGERLATSIWTYRVVRYRTAPVATPTVAITANSAKPTTTMPSGTTRQAMTANKRACLTSRLGLVVRGSMSSVTSRSLAQAPRPHRTKSGTRAALG
jgi:hypothetical protein